MTAFWFNKRGLSCLKEGRMAIDSPYEQEYWFNKISELASASRKSRVGKLAAVHTSRNSTQRVGLLLMNGTMSDAHIPPLAQKQRRAKDGAPNFVEVRPGSFWP